MGSKTILNVKCKAIFSILLEEKKIFFKAFDDRRGFCSKGERSLRFSVVQTSKRPPLPSSFPLSVLLWRHEPHLPFDKFAV